MKMSTGSPERKELTLSQCGEENSVIVVMAWAASGTADEGTLACERVAGAQRAQAARSVRW